ncbi:hypothetical protein [Candidatus Poriferisocius sp.]|uniref:hypothetical protein n=1 Tax=Candidatus Poriferisocius sp. TaxID=3101276 RepID=UPI003B019E7D
MTGRRLGLSIGIAVVVLFAVFWIGATIWFFGDENPDRLQDREWVADAEVRCAEARDDLDQLPAARDAVDLADRADQIEASTAVLADMTTDLAASAPEGDDGELVGLWLGSWETYLNDRLAHAEALRGGEDRQFRVSVERGEGVDALLDAFADRNRMPSCGDPLDIG